MSRWAFGLALRHDRFGVLTGDGRGCCLFRRGENQLELFGQPLSAHESYVLVATPFIPSRGPFGPSVGEASGVSGSCPHLLCLLLTSASRSGTLASPSVRKDATQTSRGKLDRLPRTPAESTALTLVERTSRNRARSSDQDCLYSVSVRQVAALLPRFFQTAPRGNRPCASLTLCPTRPG